MVAAVDYSLSERIFDSRFALMVFAIFFSMVVE